MQLCVHRKTVLPLIPKRLGVSQGLRYWKTLTLGRRGFPPDSVCRSAVRPQPEGWISLLVEQPPTSA